ncbi:hypothetical protein SLS55_004426 [Diplodia seriata]|uniref:Neutral amino acid permease n=1 Tax=Diplodia seriata TaxID=420778 RepID=A0ABR3CM19_9PEZI
MDPDIVERWEEAAQAYRDMVEADRKADQAEHRGWREHIGFKKGRDQQKKGTETIQCGPNTETPQQLLTPEQVVAQLQKPLDLKEDLNPRWEKTKTQAKHVLGCVERLGGFAAKGASTVFEPSELCFSAVCYLLETAQKYHDYFASLAVLFEHITPFLYRFEIYTTAKTSGAVTPSGVMRPLLQLLESFIWICCHATKIAQAGKWEKTKIALGILFFRTDGGINDQLDRIERLTSEELKMNVALIKRSVESSEAGLKDVMDFIRETEKSKEDERTQTKNQKIIKDALGINEQESQWSVTQQECQKDVAVLTGDWLLESTEFLNWSERRDGVDNPVMALEAPELCGKTYLCSQVIRALQSSVNTVPNNVLQGYRAFIGYFFVSNKTKSDKKTTVFEAVAAIVWQLTEKDRVFQKHAASKCREQGLFSKTGLLWQDVVMSYKGPRIIFFVVLDGVEQADQDDELESVIRGVFDLNQNQAGGKLQVRLFMTGTENKLDELEQRSKTNFARKKVVGFNQSDIQRFVNEKMDRAYNKNPSESLAPNSTLREDIEKTLTDLPGDYNHLNGLLNRISREEYEEGIRAILNNAAKNNQQSNMRSLIEKLDQTLDQDSIEDLNEILPWIVLPEVWPTLKQIEAVLLLSRGKSSVIPLRRRIKEKYPSPLLEIDDDDNDIWSLSTLHYFTEESTEATGEAEKDSSETREDTTKTSAMVTSNSEHQLHSSEILLVKNLLLSVCGTALYERFQFDDFFESKASPQRRTAISYHQVDGHFRITLCCLKALCGPKRTEADALHAYAVENLPWHLSMVDSESLRHTDPNARKAVGTMLHDFLTHDDCLRLWLDPRNSSDVRSVWLYNNEPLIQISRWFQDFVAMEGVPEGESRAWIAKAQYCDEHHDSMFFHASRFMAKQWLQDVHWDVSSTFLWIHGYTTRISSLGNSMTERINSDPEGGTITIEMILKTEEWAMAQLNMSNSSVCSTTRVADTLLLFDHVDRALESCKKLLERDPSYWRASWCIARAYRSKYDWESTYQTLTPIIANFKDLATIEEGPDSVWQELLRLFGECCEHLSKPEEEIEALEKFLNHFPKHWDAIKRKIHLMVQVGELEDVVKFLQSFCVPSTGTEQNLVGELFVQCADSDDFHHDIAYAAQQSEKMGLVEQGYGAAESAAHKDLDALTRLRYFHGIALFYQGDQGADILRAIKLWEENFCQVTDEDSWDARQFKYKSAKKLAAGYFHRCKRSNWDTEVADECTKKLTELRKRYPDDFGLYESMIFSRIYERIRNSEAFNECVRVHLRDALDLLCDDDPNNDWQGYFGLAEALSFIDEKNALAAWSLITPYETERAVMTLEDGEEAPDGPKSSFGSSGPLFNTCDGSCGHAWTFADDMYYCRECADVQFEKNCLTQLQNRQLKWRICSHDHEFIHIPPWDEEAARARGKDHVIVGGERMEIKAWLASIKAQYQLE